MASNVFRHQESIDTLLPFTEGGRVVMRNVFITMVVESNSLDGDEVVEEINAIRAKLRAAKAAKSLDNEFGTTGTTLESLATAIYGLLTGAAAVRVATDGRSAFKGDPSALFVGSGGSGGGGLPSETVSAIRDKLNAFSDGGEPPTQKALWDSVSDLASGIAWDLDSN